MKKMLLLFLWSMFCITAYDYFFEEGRIDHLRHAILSAVLVLGHVSYSSYMKEGEEDEK